MVGLYCSEDVRAILGDGKIGLVTTDLDKFVKLLGLKKEEEKEKEKEEKRVAKEEEEEEEEREGEEGVKEKRKKRVDDEHQ